MTSTKMESKGGTIDDLCQSLVNHGESVAKIKFESRKPVLYTDVVVIGKFLG